MSLQAIDVRPRNLPPYHLYVGEGAWERMGEIIPRNTGGIALISDEKVEGLYREEAFGHLPEGVPGHVFSFPEGEESKSRDQKAVLEDRMAHAGLGRDALVIALGGGVTSDLAGFVAATYMRGVPWIILPTTLLAMVDASIGGKTGINIEAGKNLIGTFHHPLGILADPRCLDTLPEEEKRNGLAEMAKAGAVGDRELFEDLAARKGDWIQNIARAVSVKIRVIEEDPCEKNIRQALNFGHTIGHALEHASGYGLSHGAAVGAGMHLESMLAERLSVLEKKEGDGFRQGLDAMGLHLALPSRLNRSAILEAMEGDKKKRRGELRFALPSAIGRTAPGPDGDFSIPAKRKIVEEILREAGL